MSTDCDFIALEWSLAIGIFKKLPRKFLCAKDLKNLPPNPILLELEEPL